MWGDFELFLRFSKHPEILKRQNLEKDIEEANRDICYKFHCIYLESDKELAVKTIVEGKGPGKSVLK